MSTHADAFLPAGLRPDWTWRQAKNAMLDWLLAWAAEQARLARERQQAVSPPPNQPHPEIGRAAILLRVRPDASAEEIKSAFRRRLLQAHPDHGGDAELTRRLIAARDLLLYRLETRG